MQIEKDGAGVVSVRGAERLLVSGHRQRRGTVRQSIATGGAAMAAASPNRDLHPPRSAVAKAVRARMMGRKFAMWYLFGALWVSIGMIVSATLVAFAFRA